MPFSLHSTWDCNGVAFATNQDGLHECKPCPASLDSIFPVFSTCSESHSDLVSKLLWWLMPRWSNRILLSTCKKSIKPADCSSQTLEKSSQITCLLMRLMDHLSIQEQTSWYHSYAVVATSWCFLSSCGHLLALQIMANSTPQLPSHPCIIHIKLIVLFSEKQNHSRFWGCDCMNLAEQQIL